MIEFPFQSSIVQAMIHLAQGIEVGPEAEIQQFLCYWTAFEAICAALGQRAGLKPGFVLRRNGTMQTRKLGKLKIVEVDVPSQEAQIDAAFSHFSDDLKHRLILHPGAAFFAERTPTWGDRAIEVDGFGQRLNGVIDVGRTVDRRYPVWSPLQLVLYRQYVRQGGDDKTRDLLARQVIGILQAVRRNLVQDAVHPDAAQTDQENSAPVVHHALALLRLVVTEFIDEGRYNA
ncbi:MAG: hypothetical protein JW934_21450 [Anaerolineae bacterium]|nr:hypothetical protein [Anaerolineae bacterium]